MLSEKAAPVSVCAADSGSPRPLIRAQEVSKNVMKFWSFVGKLFTHNILLKLLAVVLAVAAVVVINAV